jgi:hypothetical protein
MSWPPRPNGCPRPVGRHERADIPCEPNAASDLERDRRAGVPSRHDLPQPKSSRSWECLPFIESHSGGLRPDTRVTSTCFAASGTTTSETPASGGRHRSGRAIEGGPPISMLLIILDTSRSVKTIEVPVRISMAWLGRQFDAPAAEECRGSAHYPEARRTQRHRLLAQFGSEGALLSAGDRAIVVDLDPCCA